MDLLSHYSSSFLYAYAAGVVFLLLLCIDRFDQPVGKGSFVETLVPRHLATHKEYLRTFLIYFGVMLLIYTLLTMAGPSIVQGFQADTLGYDTSAAVNKESSDPFAETEITPENNPVWFPLAVVLLLAGTSTRYPVINAVELIVRRLTHSIIGIPQGIQKLADSINRSRIDIERLEQHEVALIQSLYLAVTGETLDDVANYYADKRPHRGLMRNWIRLKLLYDILENRRRDLPEAFDTSVWNSYPGIWTKIKSSIYELSTERIKKVMAMDPNQLQSAEREYIEHTADDVEAALRDVHSLIAACIAHSADAKSSLNEVLGFFRLMPVEEGRMDYTQALIATLILVFLFVFGVVFITPIVVDYFGWRTSPNFPTDHIKAFSWATSTVFLHGAAALAALKYRSDIGHRWKPLRIRKLEIESTQYLWVIIRAYVAATFGLLIWWILSEAFTGAPFKIPTVEQIWIPIMGVLGMATGFWVCYSQDVAERTEFVSSTRLIGQSLMQGVVTGLVCYVLLSLLPNLEADFKLYAGLIAMLNGLLIGIILILFERKSLFNHPAPSQPGASYGA